jgi:hypothetical protein
MLMRYKIFVLIILVALIVLAIERSMAGDPEKTDYSHCLACHKGIEPISANHDFSCKRCHLSPEYRSKEGLASHRQIVRNPSDPKKAETFCLPCHQMEITHVKNSLHGTVAGIINQTRYLWGAQERGSPAIYGLGGALRPLPVPDPSLYPEVPKMLVDDFLRRRCLRCHIHTPGPGGRGLYRATGCAACHMPYANDGRYLGGDQAVDRSSVGYPARHQFTRHIPNTQCLHCHNQNHVGADYEGVFEQDYNATYRFPMVDGSPPAEIYGLGYHHLARDIHREKALWCIDCHGKQDVMGDGRTYSYQMEVPKRSCSDCHGGYDMLTPDLSRGDIVRGPDGFIFVSRSRGKRHQLPLFSKEKIPHGIETHKNLRCSSCHAQWSYQDYGLSVIREDLLEGNKWHYLTAQGDPYLEKVLKDQLEGSERVYPVSRDWITGSPSPGIWSSGWRFRRWEFMPLGVDQKKRYAVLRPLYQYLISYVDRLGNVPLENVVPLRGDGSYRGWAFMPYVPHTIAPFGKRCEACHLNRVAAGMGIQEETTIDTVLTIPSPPPIKEMRLLNPGEQRRLFEPSREWKRERLKWLTQPNYKKW